MPTTPGGPPRQGAFISYARSDGETAARALLERLRTEVPDVPAWLDRLELEGGVGWWSQIERQLDRAEFLIVLMTPAAMVSANTRREWRAARQRGVCIYPVKGGAEGGLDFAQLPNWMRKAHCYDLALEWPKFVAHLRRGCSATRVPFMAPALSASHVARPREMQAVLQSLLPGAGHAERVALRGGGGYGKTTLAAAVCHDDDVIETFDDGVLWVTLGQTPNLQHELIKLYAALTGERPGFVDAEDAARELALKLEGKNCLIVIDDVWKTAHAQPFLRGGAGCTRLVTTRLADVVPEARRVAVEQMAADEALDLLLARLGSTPQALQPMRELVARLGGWPLPIKLAGSVMHQRVQRGDSESNALAYLTRALDKRGIVAFDDRDSPERSDAVGRTIELSLELLAPPERRHCAELAVFAASAAIPIAAAQTLWQLDELDSEDLARRLDDLALVEFDLRRGELRLHDLLRGFLATQLSDAAAVHARLLDAWGDPLAGQRTATWPAYTWRAYAWHLRGAGREAQLERLLLDLRWLQAKLQATQIHAVLADFEHAAPTPALAALHDALKLAAPGLALDPGQLRTQLVGRLLSCTLPEITRFVADAAATAHRPWLRLLQPTLDAPGGMLQMTLVGHGGEVSALSADAGFQQLVSGSTDGTVRWWTCSDGQPVGAVSTGRLGIRGVGVFANAALALVGGADGRLDVLDLQTQERVGRLTLPERSAITALAVSGDGRTGICASRDGKLCVWALAERTLVHTIAAHQARIASVAVCADARLAATGSDDGQIRIWKLADASLLGSFAGHPGAVNALAFTPDGRQLLSGSTDRRLMLWDTATGVCVRSFEGHQASISALAMAANSRRFVSGSSDGSARLWDLDSGRTLAILAGHADAINAIVVDAAGERAATASADRSIKLWRLDVLGAAPEIAAHGGAVVSLVTSPDGRWCASGGADGRVFVREIDSGRVLREIAAHPAPVRSLAFTADRSCVLSGGIDGSYLLWAVDTGEGFPMPIRHFAPIDYCAFSASARYLVTACQDHFVYLWDVPSGVLIERFGTRQLFDHLITPAPRRRDLPATDKQRNTFLPGETVFEVLIVRLSADGRFALLSASARDSGSLRTPGGASGREAAVAAPVGCCLLAFDIASGELRSISAEQSDPIAAFAIDASGSRMLWARSDHRIELWDLDRNQRIGSFDGHTEKVNAVVFDPRGLRAASCGRDRTLRVWDLASSAPIATFTADAALRSLAVTPDGATLLAGDVAGRVHLLQLEAPASAVSR